MTGGELILEGKKYISSKRASEISKYSRDYIGQLSRANKIEGKLIGRSWYVLEESILKHKETTANNYLFSKIALTEVETSLEENKTAEINKKPIDKDISAKREESFKYYFEEKPNLPNLKKGNKVFIKNLRNTVRSKDLVSILEKPHSFLPQSHLLLEKGVALFIAFSAVFGVFFLQADLRENRDKSLVATSYEEASYVFSHVFSYARVGLDTLSLGTYTHIKNLTEEVQKLPSKSDSLAQTFLSFLSF